MKELIKYNSSHRNEILSLFDSNVPEFFDPSERSPFLDFLKKQHDNYYSCLLNNEIVGAGGYWREDYHEARICWLMVHKRYHKKGIGKYMMNHFHKLIKEEKTYDLVTLKTAQDAEGFYETLGYKTTYFEKDHWAKGLDLYFMECTL